MAKKKPPVHQLIIDFPKAQSGGQLVMPADRAGLAVWIRGWIDRLRAGESTSPDLVEVNFALQHLCWAARELGVLAEPPPDIAFSLAGAKEKLIDLLAGAIDAGPRESAEPQGGLKPDAALILEHLKDHYPTTRSQVDIAASIQRSRRTVQERLKDLRVQGLIERPKGNRGGETLSAKGLRHFPPA